MHDDVVAGLADRRVDVEQPRLSELERVHDPAERPADERHVLGSAWENEAQLRLGGDCHLRLHAGRETRPSIVRSGMGPWKCSRQGTTRRRLTANHDHSPPAEVAACAGASAGGIGRAVPGRSTTTIAASSWGGPTRNESSADSTLATACMGSVTADRLA